MRSLAVFTGYLAVLSLLLGVLYVGIYVGMGD